MTLLDQRDFKHRLYQNLPPGWFPDLEDAPNVSAVLDMLAATWSSRSVVERTVQFDVNSKIVLIDGVYEIPIGSVVTGPSIIGNPTVVRNDTENIDGRIYQTIWLSAAQVLPAGTRLVFNAPDTAQNGIAEFLQYAKDQSRLQTATGMWLDLFGTDFFGTHLRRHKTETDESYRHRLSVNVLAPRLTRCAVHCGVTNLTGYEPTIIEPRNPGDCGSYGGLADPQWGGVAYGKAGHYGSLDLPFQFFIKATRPLGEGIPIINGYSMTGSGYSSVPQPWGYIGAQFPPNYGTGSYVSLADLENNAAVTDLDIYTQIADTVAAGVTAWTNISSDITSEIRSTGLLDLTFYLDLTTLADAAVSTGNIAIATTLQLSTSVVIAANAVTAETILPIHTVAQINNPISMHVVTPFSLQTEAAINTIFVHGIATMPALITSASVAANNTANVIFSLNLQTSAAVVTSNAATGISPIRLTTQSFATQLIGSVITIQTVSKMSIGALAVDYISNNFVIGTSVLTPPGGRLGQTFLLGASKIGQDYGY